MFLCYLQARKHPLKEPTSFFEHFVVVGLRPHSDVRAVEAAYAKKKSRQRDAEKAGADSVNHKATALEPEVVAIMTFCKHSSLYPPALEKPAESLCGMLI